MKHNGHISLNFTRLSLEEQLKRSRQFLDDMRKRRTVREFSTEPVLPELIENAIATAGMAPSGANQQPWTFVAVSDPALKKQIRQAAEVEEKESYERRMSQEWLDALAPLGTDWHKPHLEDAPYLIVVFRQAYGVDEEGNRIKHYYVDESVGIACGMLLASLHLSG
ncbi:MAG: nitroreductase family protein, partial [Anaerolineae bacterium]|nr:nitroreductase family protein [Anaerolineae bacterium]